jgi:hypothetical protein
LTRIARLGANGISKFVLIREIRVKSVSVSTFAYFVRGESLRELIRPDAVETLRVVSDAWPVGLLVTGIA